MTNIHRSTAWPKAAESVARPQFALPVINQVASQFQAAKVFTAGTDFTVPAGAAGASVTIQLPFAPIVGGFGRTGRFGDSSLTLGGAIATTLTTEVAFKCSASGDTADVTSLANGEYMVDYETGKVTGKRADNATTGTATYSYWLAGSVAGTGALATQVQGTAATNAAAVGNPVQTGGVYNASPITLDTGDVSAFQLTVNGYSKSVEQEMAVAEKNSDGYIATTWWPTSTSTDKGTAYQNNSFTTQNVKASAGTVVRAVIINTTASVRYFQLHNTATTPGGGATAAFKFQIPANSMVILDRAALGANGAYLNTGVAVGNSSVAATYTAASAGDLLVDLIYV